MVIKTVQDLIDELNRVCVNSDAQIVMQDDFMRYHTRIDVMSRNDPDARVVLFSRGENVDSEV